MTSAVLYTVLTLNTFQSSQPRDFYQFWLGGQAIHRMDIPSVYPQDSRTRITEYFRKLAYSSSSVRWKNSVNYWPRVELAGTPFLYAAFATFSSGDFDKDYQRFRIVSYLFYLGGIFILAGLAGFSPLARIPFLIFFTWFYLPFRSDYGPMNVNELQLGWLSLVLWALSRDWTWRYWLGGIIFGAFFFFKPTFFQIPIFLALVWNFRSAKSRFLQFVAGFVFAGGIAYFYPRFLLGPACAWSDWMPNFPSMAFSFEYLRHSFLYLSFGIRQLLAFKILTVALTFLTGAWLFSLRSGPVVSANPITKRYFPEKTLFFFEFLAVVLGILVFMLSSPLVHRHYFILLIPVALFCLRPDSTWLRRERSRVWVRRLLAGASILIVGFHDHLYEWGFVEDRYYSVWNFYATGILFLVILWDVMRISRLKTLELAKAIPDTK